MNTYKKFLILLLVVISFGFIAQNAKADSVVTVTANPGTVSYNGTSSITWSATNVMACNKSGGAGTDWNGYYGWFPSGTNLGATITTSPLTGTKTYTITCNPYGGGATIIKSATVTVDIPPATITLTPNPTSVVSGGSSTLTWSTANTGTCNKSGDWYGYYGLGASTGGTYSTGPITTTKTYTITCTSLAGGADVVKTISVGVMTLSAPTVTTNAVSNITQTDAVGGGNVTSNGGSTVTVSGLAWGISANPTYNVAAGATQTTNGWADPGNWPSNMTGLSPNTTYHVRAYAKNSVGISYGSDVTFKTLAVVVTLSAPTVTTNAVSNITQTDAVGGGNVTSNGGSTVTVSGLAWGTSPNPTYSSGAAVIDPPVQTTNGWADPGNWPSNMTELSPNTTYHVRAYAKNNVGISYGSDVTFKTLTTVVVVGPSSSNNVSGFGWEADDSPFGGMGWLSFNSTNDHNSVTSGIQPSAVDYGVNVDTATGNMKGYAWAGNSVDSSINGFGWIKFGGLNNFPVGPGTVSGPLNSINDGNAKLNNDGTITGWARACAVFQSQTTCDGDYYHGSGPADNNILTNKYLGGWDGWISLSGKDTNGVVYGVKVNKVTGTAGIFSGYAWGGPDTLGWIDFSNVKMTFDAPGISFEADSPLVYPPYYRTTLHWSSTVPGVTLTGCQAVSIPVSSWSGSVGNTPGALPITVPENPTAVQYNLSCCNDGSTTCHTLNKSAEVTADPRYVSRKLLPESVNLTSPGVDKGKATLTWTVVNVVPNSCVATSVASGIWSGVKTTTPNGSQSGSGTEIVNVPPTDPLFTTYTLTCDRSYPDANIVCKGSTDNTKICNSIKLNENSVNPVTTTKIIPHYIEH